MFASLRLPAIALPLSIVFIDDPISLAGAKAGVNGSCSARSRPVVFAFREPLR
jgi:hypothetical protein